MNLSNPKVKKALQIVGLGFLFVFSFVFFLYLTFPYEVLKESIAAEVSSATGYSVQIGDMGPKIPLGIKAQNVRIEAPSGTAAMSFDRLNIGVGILPILIGRLSIDTEIEDAGGALDLGLDFGLLSLARQEPTPRSVSLEAEAFPIDDIAKFGLAAAGSGPNANPMLTPILTAIGLTGKLEGNVDFALDANDATQSKGSAELKINNAMLKLSDPTLGLPDQIFSKALIKAKVEGGTLVIDNNSGFVAEELELAMDGKVTLKPEPTNSALNLKVAFKLNSGLKDKFGFLIDAILGRASGDGQITMQILGSLGAPAISTF